jgi:hypothetical protein
MSRRTAGRDDTHRGGDGRGEAGALGQVGRLDGVHDQRLGPEGADRVDDHGQRRAAPGLDQPDGLAVGDHELHAGRHEAAEPADHRGADAIVVAELVAEADHHDRHAAGTGHGNHRSFV